MNAEAASPASDDIEIESNSAPQAAPSVHVPPAASVDLSQEDDDALEASDELVPAKRDRSLQARINEQTAKQRSAERERDEARQVAAEYQRRLEALEQPRQPERPAEPRYTRAKPTEHEIGTKYDDSPAFIEDLTYWKEE